MRKNMTDKYIISNNLSFFDKYAEKYDSKEKNSTDPLIAEFINKNSLNKTSSLLDVGGGAGIFANFVTENCPLLNVTVIEPSINLANKIKLKSINKEYGYLPNNIHLKKTFDYIHIKEVIHHISGRSIDESKDLFRESLFTLQKLLNKNGYLFLREIYYEGYLIPTLPRTIIFNILHIQNKLRIKIPAKAFLLDLNVCFYTRREISLILEECGFQICEMHEDCWNNSIKKKALLLNDWGRVLFVVKKT
jgi:hypothetical protein